MTTTTITAADLLDEAASLIRRRGWTQGDYTNPVGCLCVRGAFHVAAGRRADDCELEKPLSLAVCPCEEPSRELAVFLFLPLSVDDDGNEIEGSEPDAVSRWNDAPDMTADEAVETLRRVAEHLRKRKAL